METTTVIKGSTVSSTITMKRVLHTKAYKRSPFTVEDVKRLLKEMSDRYVTSTTHKIERTRGDNGEYIVLIYDVYFIKDIFTTEFFRYQLAKLRATTLRYIGMRGFKVVVIGD